MSVVEISGPARVGRVRKVRRRIPLMVTLSFCFLIVVSVMIVFGASVAPHDPAQQNLLQATAPPGNGFVFGTDDLGRDVLARVIAGARTAVLGPLVIATFAGVVGSVLGVMSGFLGGWVDALVMRWVDLMLALPGLLVILVVAGVAGSGYAVSVALLALFSAPFCTRIVRGAVRQQAALPYVEAAQTLGMSKTKIMVRYLWPNIAPFVVAEFFADFAINIVALAGLSFLGVGVADGTADWGLMLANGKDALTSNPWFALAPGLMLASTATSATVAGDWLFERFEARGGHR